jgi:hypothetical protein
LPVVYFAFAHAALVTALLLVALWPQDIAGFFYHPKMLAAVHLVTLGWISSSIVGATYLVAPFALRTNLVAGKADSLACGAIVVGASGIVMHLWLEGYLGLVASGTLLFAGLAYVAHRVWGALRASRAPAGVRLLVALAWANVLLAGLYGLLLGANKALPFLPGAHLDWVLGHAHLAAVGWAVLMVVGIGYRLLPMFLPAEPPVGRSLVVCAALLEGGVLGLSLALPLAPGAAPAFAAAIVAGLGVFFFDVGRMLLRPRKRPPQLPVPDLGMLHAFQALVYLLLTAAIGLSMLLTAGWQPARIMIYGVFGLFGFLGQIVLGIGMRLLPVSAWTAALHHGGFDPSRPPAHAIPRRGLQHAVLVLWTLGVPALAVGLAGDRIPWVRAGGWLLGAAALLASVNFARIVRQAYPPRSA